MNNESILVVGTGQMGPEIALSFAAAGFRVTLVGRREESLESAAEKIRTDTKFMAESELLGDQDVQTVVDRITGQTDLDSAAIECTYVCEAIVEDVDTKKELFSNLESLVSKDTVITSNTSALSPTELQSDFKYPERFVVTHYAQPAHIMPVIEVVPGAETSSQSIERAYEVLQACGIEPVQCRDVPGFLFSRLQSAVLREAVAMVRDEVATAEDIEKILKFGYGARLPAMGPFEHADLAGMNLIQSTANTIWPDLDNSKDASESLIAKLIEEGNTGMEAGQGFHDWEERDPDELRRQRDEEIIRRRKVIQGNS